MNSSIRVARAYTEEQALDAVQKDGFDLSIVGGVMTDATCRIFCNSDELLDMVKGIFSTENSISYNARLGVVLLDVSPDVAEQELRRVLL